MERNENPHGNNESLVAGSKLRANKENNEFSVRAFGHTLPKPHANNPFLHGGDKKLFVSASSINVQDMKTPTDLDN